MLQPRGGGVGRRDEVVRRRQTGDPGQLLGVADRAVGAALDRRAVEAVAKIARVVAPDQDAPGLGIIFRVAQRAERHADLGLPALGGDRRRGVIEKIGRLVLVARGVVEEVVPLDAARVDPDLHRRALVVARIEEDGDVVVGADHVVALDVGGADLRRLGVVGLDADVQVAIVVGEIRRRLHLRREVVAGRCLVEAVDDQCVLPPRIAEVAVHADPGGGAGQRLRRGRPHRRRHLRGPDGCREKQAGGQNERHPRCGVRVNGRALLSAASGHNSGPGRAVPVKRLGRSPGRACAGLR